MPPRNLTTDEIRVAVTQAANFYKCSIDGLYEKIEPSNSEVSDLAHRIFDIHDKIEVVRVVLISDGLCGLKSLDIKRTKDGARVLVDLYGIERLRRILGDGLTRDDIVLDVVAEMGQPLRCLKAFSSNGDYDAYMTAIPASLIADIYEKYGTRLLELNVRAFLGLRGRTSVNAALRQTILEEPTHFLAYNNGIVATADEVGLSVSHGDQQISIERMRGLQIVNGGQTTASLHRARKQDTSSLDGIMVPAKIIQVNGENLDAMVAAISRCANSQNTIQPADFSANDPFHVAVENLANNTWLADQSGRWFYERARGSYTAAEYRASFRAGEKRRFASETPKERRFSKTDLAKYLNAWDGFPHFVSYGNQKNFQYFMQRLKDEYRSGFRPDTDWYKAFIAKAVLYRAAQKVVRASKFPAYQSNIVAYTIAMLGWKSNGTIDFNALWISQTISPELEGLIGRWAGQIDHLLRVTAGKRMPSEWAKKSECWEQIRSSKLEISAPVPSELAGATNFASAVGQQPSPADFVESDADYDDLICSIRQLFRGAEIRTRQDIITAMQGSSDSTSLPNGKSQEEFDGVIRAAVRRGILEHKNGGLVLCGRTIGDYDRSFLKDQFIASIRGYDWTERGESIRRFARWLGFRRTGPFIDEAARSLINGLIRDGRLESHGSQVRRLDN